MSTSTQRIGQRHVTHVARLKIVRYFVKKATLVIPQKTHGSHRYQAEMAKRFFGVSLFFLSLTFTKCSFKYY